LDELIGDLGSDASKKEEAETVTAESEKKIEMVAAPELTIKEALATQPKADVADQSVDLEQKAKDMLKDLGAPTQSAPPTKKRSGGAATKMALVAVLMVLMGAGGIVGVNLFKINQSTDNRSQAGGTGGGCIYPYKCEDTCTNGLKKCFNNPGEICGTELCDGAQKCHCCDGSYVVDTEKTASGSLRACSLVCAYNGGGEFGSAACETDGDVVTKCSCASVSDACGTNCSFPSDTQARLNEEARNSNCTKVYVAMCNVNYGSVSIDEYNESNACWGKLGQCGNPTSTCTGDNPTPTPTIVPGTFQCTSISKSKTPALNDSVTFTCTGSGEGINHYEFRYKIDSGEYQSLAVGSGNTSSALTISTAGTYTAQCRVCKSADATDCTTWGQVE